MTIKNPAQISYNVPKHSYNFKLNCTTSPSIQEVDQRVLRKSPLPFPLYPSGLAAFLSDVLW